MPEGITLKPVREHIEVYYDGKFLFSADDEWEADKELNAITAEDKIYKEMLK